MNSISSALYQGTNLFVPKSCPIKYEKGRGFRRAPQFPFLHLRKFITALNPIHPNLNVPTESAGISTITDLPITST
jgi:hypothetical protein